MSGQWKWWTSLPAARPATGSPLVTAKPSAGSVRLSEKALAVNALAATAMAGHRQQRRLRHPDPDRAAPATALPRQFPFVHVASPFSRTIDWRDQGFRLDIGRGRALSAETLTSREGSPPMKGYVDNIAVATIANDDFRRVLYNRQPSAAGADDAAARLRHREEVHEDRDQFFRFEEGEGELRIDGVATRSRIFRNHRPPAARHNVINTGSEPLKLYTLYGPPEHRDGIVHKTKEQAERDHANDHWDGETTE
jgi:mannose-6-phosphate isomerase-like protein (cupin superfamily)